MDGGAANGRSDQLTRRSRKIGSRPSSAKPILRGRHGVWDEDPRIADERLRLAEKTIQGRDFTCMRETVNAIEAWLGSLPGHVSTMSVSRRSRRSISRT